MSMGNVGDSNTLVWLFCELHAHGKVLIRQGWRKGLPKDKKPIWTFCPLKKGQFPRDRILIENCEKCSHYKGVSHSLKRGQKSDSKSKPMDLTIIKPKKRKKETPIKVTIPLEDFLRAIEEKEEQDEEWQKEEQKLFGDDETQSK